MRVFSGSHGILEEESVKQNIIPDLELVLNYETGSVLTVLRNFEIGEN